MASSDPTDWWYYFDKVDVKKNAKCKHCDWKKPRGENKSTRLLKYHLEHAHPEQFSKKLEAERIKKKEEDRKRKMPSVADHFAPSSQAQRSALETLIDVEQPKAKKYHIFGML